MRTCFECKKLKYQRTDGIYEVGPKFTCSAGHWYLTFAEWVRLKDIRKFFQTAQTCPDLEEK